MLVKGSDARVGHQVGAIYRSRSNGAFFIGLDDNKLYNPYTSSIINNITPNALERLPPGTKIELTSEV